MLWIIGDWNILRNLLAILTSAFTLPVVIAVSISSLLRAIRAKSSSSMTMVVAGGDTTLSACRLKTPHFLSLVKSNSGKLKLIENPIKWLHTPFRDQFSGAGYIEIEGRIDFRAQLGIFHQTLDYSKYNYFTLESSDQILNCKYWNKLCHLISTYIFKQNFGDVWDFGCSVLLESGLNPDGEQFVDGQNLSLYFHFAHHERLRQLIRFDWTFWSLNLLRVEFIDHHFDKILICHRKDTDWAFRRRPRIYIFT